MNLAIDVDLTEDLRSKTIGVSLSYKKFGATVAADDDVKDIAATALKAETESLRISERIIGKDVATYKAITKHMTKLKRELDEMSIDTPIRGVRLMRLDKVDEWKGMVEDAQQKLEELVEELDNQRDVIIDDAKMRLGDAFSLDHYPDSFLGTFSIDCTYPSIGPDERLKQIAPEIYEEQVRRTKAMFDQAIAETTEALAIQFKKLIDALVEKLGDSKRIKSNVFEPMQNFLEVFENVRLGASPSLQAVVDQAREIVSNYGANDLRNSTTIRESLASSMEPILNRVESLVESNGSRYIEI